MIHHELVGASDVGHSVRDHHGLLHVGVRVVHQTHVVLEEPAVVVVQTRDELVNATVDTKNKAKQPIGDLASKDRSEERGELARRTVHGEIVEHQTQQRVVVQLVEKETDLTGRSKIGLSERHEECVHCE